MMRIVVLGQPGEFGSAWCRRAATRLAQRLDLPCVAASDVPSGPGKTAGWVATTAAGACSDTVLQAADTAVWLHYSPLAVMRAWLRGLTRRLAGSSASHQSPRLADVRDSVLHMAWTPQVHRLLRHPALGHLQIFHLRNPDETDFWLRIQEHRLRAPQPTLAQTA
jgi:hypothetical protein